MSSLLRLLAVLCILIFSHVPAYAVDGVSFELISGDKTQIGRVGLQWKWQSVWFPTASSSLSAYWDTSLAQWRGTQYQNLPDNIQRFNDFGVAAVFRVQQREESGFYAEAGTGPHYLTDYYDNNGKRQSSHLVFNSHVGAGFVWKNGVDLGFRAMHISNGRISTPNDAVNILGMGLRYWW